jgi:hypothetical protein
MRPMFNRRATSSTDMRLLGESANPSALDCVLLAIALPDVFTSIDEAPHQEVGCLRPLMFARGAIWASVQ